AIANLEALLEKIQSAHIKLFKRLEDAPFDLGNLNVVIGANNSGKSSLIQGLHFAIGLLQTIALANNWNYESKFEKNQNFSTSINPVQLIYTPAEDALAYGGRLLESADKSIEFDFTFASGEKFAVKVRKGRNRNGLVAIDNVDVALNYSFLDRPFSVFSPGLAGISKNENMVSDGLLFRALARGDANLVLRNILWRLWKTEQWNSFLSDLQSVFPEVDLEIEFDQNIDEHIAVYVKTGSHRIPLDLAGTGVLQAAQILSYMHKFAPKLIVLDE